MKIGIIGAGSVGGNLGRAWADSGHDVAWGVRDQSDEDKRALAEEAGENARLATISEAADFGDVVVLAVPFGAVEMVLDERDLAGTTVVDATNPVGVDLAASGAERVAELAPEASVVKSFNQVGAEHLLDPTFDGQPATTFYCGDDADAKETVADLGSDLGFEMVDAGDLSNAGTVEQFAEVWIFLSQQLGREFAFSLLRSTE